MRYNDGMASEATNDIEQRAAEDSSAFWQFNEHVARTQAFFANLNAETLKPHYGDVQRQVVQEILKRAAEAGLYEANT